MSEFRIDYDSGGAMSFNDLLAQQEAGYSVMRSPHAQLSVASLGIAAIGIKTVLYGDSYIFSGDLSKEVVRNKPTYIGDISIADLPDNRTMTRFVNASYGGFEANTLTSLHAEVCSSALGASRVNTWKEYVNSHHDLFKTIIEASIDLGLRYKDGVNVETGEWGYWQKETHIEDVLDASEESDFMAVAPLDCKLALMFIAEANDTQNNRVFHIAGRDMLSYLPAKSKTIDLLVQAAQAKGLVGDLEVVTVPSAATRIITSARNADILEKFWDLAGRRDAISRKLVKSMLQSQSLKDALEEVVNVADAINLGGDGLHVIKSSLDIPINNMRHRLRKF